MSDLQWMLIVGVVLLLVFVWLLFPGRRKWTAAAQSSAKLAQMVPLPGLSFQHANRVLDPADYRALQCAPMLRNVARELLADRRHLALLWLKMLQDDLFTLWRFRRLLTTYGVSGGVTDEVSVAARALTTLTLLLLVRSAVWLTGPFAILALLQNAPRRVEAFSRLCAGLLESIPNSRWNDIERRWSLAS